MLKKPRDNAGGRWPVVATFAGLGRKSEPRTELGVKRIVQTDDEFGKKRKKT